MTVGDHDQPYAPMVFPYPRFVELGAQRRDRFRAAWLDASRSRSLTVLGPPMKVLMPPDPNPFPRIRLIGRTR